MKGGHIERRQRKPTAASEFLTKGDISRITGVLPDTIRRDAELGKLCVAARTPNGTRLFERSEVERWQRAREAAAR